MKNKLLILCLVVTQLGFTKTVSFNKDSTTFYFEELNTVEKPKGLLVLFNGGNGDPRTIDKETQINEYADSADIQCIAIWQGEWFIGDSSYNMVKTIIKHASEKYKIPTKKLYFGGFSLGGFTTLRMAELAVEKGDVGIIPQAIFTIDPPVNYLDLYNYWNRELNRNCEAEGVKKVGKAEANWIKNLLEKSLGIPAVNDSLYIKESAYSENGGNAKFLVRVPIMFLHEIDIMFTIKQKCRDLRDANIYMTSQMANYLHSHNNNNIKVITTQNKGFRSDGRRHPHSWSIAEPKVVFDFLLQF